MIRFVGLMAGIAEACNGVDSAEDGGDAYDGAAAGESEICAFHSFISEPGRECFSSLTMLIFCRC